MLAGSIIKNITRKSKGIKQIINEDAYIGMVTNALHIYPKDEERFLPFIFSKKGVNQRTLCDWKNHFLMHGVSPEQQLKMHWNSLRYAPVPILMFHS